MDSESGGDITTSRPLNFGFDLTSCWDITSRALVFAFKLSETTDTFCISDWHGNKKIWGIAQWPGIPSLPPTLQTTSAQRRHLKACAIVDSFLQVRLTVFARLSRSFSLRITPEMRRASNSADPNDPIARQFVPTRNELQVRNEERTDPIGDDVFTKTKGLIHRYPDRVVLQPTQTCQVYCRYCFRREKVGAGTENLKADELVAALDYVRRSPDVWEVILSGGDPLVLGDRRLEYILASLDEVQHVKVIRFHSRVPVVEPSRITDDLVRILRERRCVVYIVVHVNHPNELTENASKACALLVDNGIPLLAQSVLLKGVNDSAATLSELMRTLICNRIKPYYLHQLDMAQGTDHFRVPIAEGQRIMAEMRGRVSGICQPLYVLDIPGGYGKTPIGPGYISHTGGDDYRVRDYRGQVHDYRDLAHFEI